MNRLSRVETLKTDPLEFFCQVLRSTIPSAGNDANSLTRKPLFSKLEAVPIGPLERLSTP